MVKKKEYDSEAHNFLKAEAFCAEMITNGFSFDSIKLISESNFKKSFRNEIDEVSFKVNEDLRNVEMELRVNRDGIYDRLPEGIFHQTRGNSKTLTTSQMTEEYRRFREEEKQARKFFQPLEQEFFRFATMVEQEERNLAFGMLNGNLKSELFRFWDIPIGLPEKCVRKLVQVMPWANRIKGDPELTSKALSIILSTPVLYEQIRFSEHYAPGSVMHMGEGALGIDTVIGNNFSEPSVFWKFSILDIKKKEIELYRAGNSYGKLLKQFEEIFIPLPIDIIFDFSVLPAEDFETEDVLGYSMVL